MVRQVVFAFAVALAGYYLVLAFLWGSLPVLPPDASPPPSDATASDAAAAREQRPPLPAHVASSAQDLSPGGVSGQLPRPPSTPKPVRSFVTAGPVSLAPGDEPGQRAAPVEVRRLAGGEVYVVTNLDAAQTDVRNRQQAAHREAVMAEMAQHPAAFAVRHRLELEDVQAALAGERESLIQEMVRMRTDLAN